MNQKSSQHLSNMSDTNEETQQQQTETESLTVSSDRISTLITRFENLVKESRTIISELKTTRREVVKLEKRKKGRRARDPNRPKGSGEAFKKPVAISDELSNFLELEVGVMLPRPEVIKKITAYVKKYDLQRPEDRRKINVSLNGGEALAKLLNIEQDYDLDFFNLQTLLVPHFIKDGSTTTEEKRETKTETKTEEKKSVKTRVAQIRKKKKVAA